MNELCDSGLLNCASQPTNRLRLVYWVIVVVGVVVVIIVVICLIALGWFCFTKRTKRKRYYFGTGRLKASSACGALIRNFPIQLWTGL